MNLKHSYDMVMQESDTAADRPKPRRRRLYRPAATPPPAGSYGRQLAGSLPESLDGRSAPELASLPRAGKHLANPPVAASRGAVAAGR